MTGRSIIEEERLANLDAFEETFATLEGVGEEHVRTLRRAITARPGSHYSRIDDPLGQAAYTAAALRGLAEAVAALQGNEARPTTSAAK